jgi:hypothetical protein
MVQENIAFICTSSMNPVELGTLIVHHQKVLSNLIPKLAGNFVDKFSGALFESIFVCIKNLYISDF